MVPVAYAVDFSKAENNPLAKFGNLAEIVNLVVPILFIGAALIFLASFFYGGYTIIVAGGEPKLIQKAQSIIKYAVIGLLIVLVSFLTLKVIEIVLNINLPL
ncbi:hypothetical protein A2W49_01235 [Candidatus Roizmanbacteria bacterium RIFCSPHIGHO2_12_41_18]|nr:MAG: hypothetical protein A2W49_01235 [Candidatus Roizmanbacteria bacterium RIFCSPHIGHO2_12_41_18]